MSKQIMAMIKGVTVFGTIDEIAELIKKLEAPTGGKKNG